MTYKDQLSILEDMQKDGYNVCECGDCGGILLFKNTEEVVDFDCLHCGKEMDYSDCPDLYVKNTKLFEL